MTTTNPTTSPMDDLAGEKSQRALSDPQRMLWRDDVEGICRSPDMCFEYNTGVRCAPCAIKQATARGIDSDMSIPGLPEVSRLRRELEALRSPIAPSREEEVERDNLKLARKCAAEVICREKWKPGVKAGMYEDIMAGMADEEPIVQIALAALASIPPGSDYRRGASAIATNIVLAAFDNVADCDVGLDEIRDALANIDWSPIEGLIGKGER